MLGLESWRVESMAEMGLAAVLGGLVGLERQYHGRAAGLRTHLLVCVGCCLVMIVSLHFERVFALRYTAESAIRIDPARIGYSVMSGIGFLGAGVIIKWGFTIRGLTTAASLWCTAAVGMACGFAMYFEAVFATALVLFALMVLNTVERTIVEPAYKLVRVTCDDAADRVEQITGILRAHGVRVMDVNLARDADRKRMTITCDVRYADPDRTRMPGFFLDLVRHDPSWTVELERAAAPGSNRSERLEGT